MKVPFRPPLLNRVRGLTVGKSPSGSITCGSTFQTVRIVSSQVGYFNSKSKPSNHAQWEKNAKEELERPRIVKALDLAGSDGIAGENIAIQPDCKMPETHRIVSAEEVNTFDPPSTIDSQIDCAKEQLKSFVKLLQENDETFSSKKPIIQEIASRLDGGMVPPLFHALGMPLEWIGGNKLCFSLNLVEPGHVKEESILHLELRARNKKKLVGTDSKAVKCIKDKCSISWLYDEIATNWAVNLVNTDANMRGSNVESTAVGNISSLINNSEQILLTRPQSRGVVATIFNKISTVNSRSTKAITGLPGIGKSWTLLYVLQQALLYEGVFIVFITDDSNRFLFHRKNGKLYAWMMEKAAESFFLDSEETLVILDPSEADNIDVPGGMRHLIYAVSDQEKNFMKRDTKQDPEVQYYVGPWTEDELRAAFRDFKKDEGLLFPIFLERVRRIGGLPCYLMTKQRFKCRLLQIVESVKELKTFEDLQRSMHNAADEMIAFSDTISGSLYSVAPRMDMEVDYVDYDGKCFLYQDRVLKWASETILDFVLNKFRKEILTFLGKTSDYDFVEMGHAAEKLFLSDLEHGGLTFDCWKMKKNSNDVAAEESLEIPRTRNISKPKTASEAYKCIAELFQDSSNKNTLIVCPRNFPAVDAIRSGRQVLRVTISEDHSMNPDGMKNILVSAGILAANGDRINEGAQPISFYWVVLPEMMNQWKNKRNELKPGGGILQKAMTDFVEQFVLKIPIESILHEEPDVHKIFGMMESKQNVIDLT